MAKGFTADYLSYTGNPGFASNVYPCSISTWFRVSTPSTGQTAVCLGGYHSPPSIRDEQFLQIGNSKLRMYSQDAGAFAYAEANVTLSADTWYHGGGVAVNGASRSVYLNGGNKDTDTTANIDPAPVTWIQRIGQRSNPWDSSPFTGRQAEVGAWDVALSDDEFAALGAGYSPLCIRPADLVMYIPLLRGVFFDRIWGIIYTEVGTLTDEDHPPGIIYPHGPVYVPKLRYITPDVVWGHVTGVTEPTIRTWKDNWTGTGLIVGSGDGERIALSVGENLISEIVNTGAYTVTLLANVYDTGDTPTIEYRHGATPAACEAAGWNNYSTPFTSLGYVQIRLSP